LDLAMSRPLQRMQRGRCVRRPTTMTSSGERSGDAAAVQRAVDMRRGAKSAICLPVSARRFGRTDGAYGANHNLALNVSCRTCCARCQQHGWRRHRHST
jgi:hypothetical protein